MAKVPIVYESKFGNTKLVAIANFPCSSILGNGVNYGVRVFVGRLRTNIEPYPENPRYIVTVPHVWVKDKKVVAVTPHAEFRPFFDLQYEGMSHYVLHWRPRGDLNPRSPP